MDLQPGTQIAYVPTHAGGDLDHPIKASRQEKMK